jgi:hypothetical protein
MSKLQQLLDEKFPVTHQMDHTDEEINKIQRQAFTEGYNAANVEDLGLYNSVVYKHLESVKYAISVLEGMRPYADPNGYRHINDKIKELKTLIK